jgi:hypothetical protein
MEQQPSQPDSGDMEGDGTYNRFAKFQADGSTIALVLIQEAAQRVEISGANEPIVIADYGSSQGKNSLVPMRTTIEILRGRIGIHRPIMVCHVDLPVNDFNSLFRTLDSDPDSYSRSAANVYSCAIGRSFYQNVLPPNCVHIGWSAYAVQWLSCIPTVTADHFWFMRLHAAARAVFERQAAGDWQNFLALRAIELRPGGRLVVVCPGIGDCQTIADHVDPVIADMVRDGAISVDERARMVIAGWQRSEREYRAPFQQDGRFQNLTVEHYESASRADPIWEQYKQDGDTENFATKQAAHFRATFVPSLAAVLRRANDAQGRQAFADRIEHGLKQRLLRDPTPYSARVDAIVFAKLAPQTA